MNIPQEPKNLNMFIDGQYLPASEGGSITRISPSHDIPVTTIPEGTSADVEKAVAAAKKAFETGPWPSLSGAEKSDILYAIALKIQSQKEELALYETLENGKPLSQSKDEVEWTVGIWKHASALCRHLYGESCNTLGEASLGMTLRDPVGVVGMITPWNFPLLIASQKVPYALAAGCTMVIKPSELTSATTIALGQILKDCGVPDGVFNVVTGYGNPVGQSLIEHKDVDMLSFTGSTVVGKAIAKAASEHLKKVSLELGGKNPMIVMDDANLEDAVDAARLGAFFNMGECCNASSRILVQEGIADAFVEKLSSFAADLVVDDPMKAETKLGAIINDQAEEKILAYIEKGKAEGAKVCIGGNKKQTEKGRYIETTILDHVPADSPVATEEVFGPVLSIIRFKTLDEAIAIANGTDYGLSSGIFTNDYNQAMKATRALRAGTVWVNTWLEGHNEQSFGGFKQSGLGRELGSKAVEEYTEAKSVIFSLGKRSPWW